MIQLLLLKISSYLGVIFNSFQRGFGLIPREKIKSNLPFFVLEIVHQWFLDEHSLSALIFKLYEIFTEVVGAFYFDIDNFLLIQLSYLFFDIFIEMI